MEVMSLIKFTLGIAFSVPVIRFCYDRFVRDSVSYAVEVLREKRRVGREQRERTRREINSALYMEDHDDA